MTRIRLILLSMLAVFAASAIASASASAAGSEKDTPEGTLPVFCSKGLADEDELGTTKVTSTGGIFKLEVTGEPSLECTAETDEATINSTETVAGTDSKVKIKFTGCTVKGNPKCTVQDSINKTIGTIEPVLLKSKLKALGGKIYDVFAPEAGTTFVTVEVKNKGTETCVVKGTFKVEGEACGLTSETLAKEAPLNSSKAIEEECKAAKKLELGKKAAFLNGESKQKLASGEEWATVLT